MLLGHSAGAVAALAIDSAAGAVHAVDPALLRADLLRGGMKLDVGASPAQSGGYDCLKQRCIQGSAAGSGTHLHPSCDGACAALQPSEWIALDDFFTIDSVRSTMEVNAAAPVSGTFLKKSELHSAELPPSELLAVRRGDRFNLRSWVKLDAAYTLVELA